MVRGDTMSGIQKAKTLIKLVASGEMVRDFKSLAGGYLHQPDATCPCCGHVGKFCNFGSPIRPGAMCPKCFAMERQRLLALAVERGTISFAGKRVLHFAPELATRRLILAGSPARYQGSSYPPSPDAELSLNIEAMDLADRSVDMVVCSHVLEHVDDHKALAEIFRVLDTGGQMLAMVPIVEGWPTTYENKSKVSEEDRRIHFGQFDHVRYYGADFRDRIRAAGFALSEFWLGGEDTFAYSLMRGERIFIGTKA